MKFSTLALTLCMIVTSSAAAQPSNPKNQKDLDQALDIATLKLQMAENNVRLRPSFKNIAELVSGLEESVNSACFKDLHRSLRYDGQPTDPTCVERMERLLQLNPDNPTALCLRDGIEAQTCTNAYRDQLLVSWSSSSAMELPDPILKVGLRSAEVKTLDDLRALVPAKSEALRTATDEAAKWKALEDLLPLYDTMLGTACRIVVVRLREKEQTDSITNNPLYAELKEKLLKIPKPLRGDYQENMAHEYEEKLAQASSDEDRELYKAVIILARDPEATPPITSATADRVRFVLPVCAELINEVTKTAPFFPSPICHKEGWYTPQCITALKGWLRFKQQRLAAQPGPKGTPGTAKKNPIISEF